MLTSIIRTLSAMLAGWLLSLPVVSGLGLDETAVTSAVAAGLAAAYYLLVRAVESRYPWVGRLLGKVGAPQYPGKAG